MNKTRNKKGPEKAVSVLVRIRNLQSPKDQDPDPDRDSEKTHRLEINPTRQILKKRRMGNEEGKMKIQDLRVGAGPEGLL